MDVGAGPWEGEAMYFYNQCGEIPLDFTQEYPTINSVAEFVGVNVSGYYVGGIYSYTITGTVITWTWTWTEDLTTTECGKLAAAYASAFTTLWAPFIPTTTTPCPNCQDVAITNCGPVDISLPLPDDDYTVTLYDNQTGVSYTQTLTFVSGTGTWNSTNTAGVFTPFSIFTLTVTDSEGTPVSWPVGPNEYTCARVTFSATVDTNDAG